VLGIAPSQRWDTTSTTRELLGGRSLATSAPVLISLALGRSFPRREIAGSRRCSSCSPCKPGRTATVCLGQPGGRAWLSAAAGGNAARSLCSCAASPELVRGSLESITTIDSEGGVAEKHPGAPVLSHASVRAPLSTSERQLHHPKVQ